MATQVRSAYSDLFLNTMLPAIKKVIMESYESYRDILPYIFNVEKSDRSIEQTTTVSGFGLVPSKNEGSSVDYETLDQGYDRTYTHLTYKLGFTTSKEMMDDEKYGLMRKASQALSRSMYNTRQTVGSNHFNNAFSASFLGPDAVALCSTAHTRTDGGTWSNRLAADADLSVTSLRTLLNVLEDTVDDKGLLLNLEAKYLLIPNELEFDAEELLKSSLRPDTAENAINAFTIKKLSPLVWNYLTDADAWFLCAEPSMNNLMWFDREPVNTTSSYDFDNDNGKTKIRARFSSGWADARGICGTPGV